ncbi:MAG TPA: NAD-glutamate dehydrogenase [Acidimicrobiia bacterium]|nr:NAD-glutamate dehydrogenase [Acidimicrobiia bacterium]
MVGTESAETSHSSLVDQLLDLIEAEDPPEYRDMLRTFATLYLKRLPDADVPDLTPDQLMAEVVDLLSFIDERRKGETAVRVFRPTLAECGYEIHGSVVQVVADDSPFLVDSITMAVGRMDAGIERHLHPVVGTVRNTDGRITALSAARGSAHRESIQHVELSRVLEPDEEAQLKEAIHNALRDVECAVRDFDPMREKVAEMEGVAKASVHFYDYEEVAETVAFLEWLLDDNFVFLGYRTYRITESDRGKLVSAIPESGLGILSPDGEELPPVPLDELPPHLRDRYTGGSLLVISKTNRHASVHRDARMDYIGMRQINEDGVMVAELRLLGLFTSKAYMTPASEIPVLRRKLAQVLVDQDVIEGSHDYKSLVQVFESFPKDDLFAMNVDALTEVLGDLVETEEASTVRLFVRRDALSRYVGTLVTLPRDRFNADLRKQLQDLFLRTFGGHAIDYRLALGESGDARIHFSVWVEEGAPIDVDVAELERTVIAMARNWDDRVVEELMSRVDEGTAKRLGVAWAGLFPSYYKTSMPIEIAAGDILKLDRLMKAGQEVAVGVQNEALSNAPDATDRLSRITVYRSSGKLNLSAMMPLIEHLGLAVVEEVPTRLKNEQGTFIHDFGVLTRDGGLLDVETDGPRIEAALEAVLRGEAESDSLHRLLISSTLDHDDLTVLRAYRAYWRLVTPAFSVGYVDDTLSAHPEVAEMIVRLFQARFSSDNDPDVEQAIVTSILNALNEVSSLDEDRILRGFLDLIRATERTNYRVPGRTSLSLKFRSGIIPDMPEPAPLFEIYVSSRDVEGVHLRGGMVARGGIRWSDRREDYRTEVLGLMKAQMTKNAVIVPTGAKGGFVMKRHADAGGPTYDEVRAGYETFIRGLLDVTDNRVGDSIVGPDDVVRHDDDDPYLVVAADKGTASFSDTANALAADYGFWLDDAFASGGSAGYDHKALGITARGAWESVRRHFFDLGVDVDADEVTAVGIGDMSGDVFGNGMLLSKHLRLVAAFDHRHIFIDPDPDPAAAWIERSRIAGLGRSSWQDYDPTVISNGGGVFPRSVKRIDLTPEMRKVLGTDAEFATPSGLIRMILMAPVDLLWNGGIGTYVKSRSETNAEVQDRSNDAVRVDARDLRCRVVGEGGNLGFTQLGRIEFDNHGGRIFTDFIDNSGGVHASDREVNLKILLRMAQEAGEITRSERDEIIESVSDDVVSAILYDNFLQAQMISQEAENSRRTIEAYIELTDRLEREGLLTRDIEFLPSTEEMTQRSREGKGMSRPEIAVLLAYAKMSLTEHLRVSTLPDDKHFVPDLLAYFPPRIVERFEHLILQHPLRRELISTIVANQVLNSQGSTYYSRMRTVSGSSAAMIVRAYRIARAVTDAQSRWHSIEELGASVRPETARMMLQDIDLLVTLVSRWYLMQDQTSSIDEEVAAAKEEFARLSDGFPNLGPEEWREPYERVASDLVAQGVPADLAVRHAYQRVLRRGPDIVDLANRFDRDVMEVAEIYTQASQEFMIGWVERQIRLLPGTTAFDRLAIAALRDDLQILRREVVSAILSEADGSIDAFIDANDRVMPRIERWHRWLSRDGILDVSAGFIATRRLHQILVP